MAFFYWTLTALAIIIDMVVVIALRKRNARVGMWAYGVFAFVCDIVTRIVPYINPIGERAPLIPVFCGYLFLLTACTKVIIAAGWMLGRRRPTRRRAWMRRSLILATLFLTMMIAGTVYPTRNLHVEHVECSFDNLPEAFDGVRIGFFTDVHIGCLTSSDKLLNSVVDSLNSAECLFAVNGGDIVNIRNSELTPHKRSILARLRMPVYSVMGNHDLGYYRRDTLEYSVAQSTADLKAIIDTMGWMRLDNDSRWIHYGGDSIVITGIEFNRKAADDRHKRDVGGVNIDSLMSTIPEGSFNIAVSHIPQYWHRIAASEAGDLTLSGHTHAMQCVITVRGHRFSPASLLYDEWGGRYDKGGKTLYISEGVGFAGIPIRIGTPPQIAIITLRRCE